MSQRVGYVYQTRWQEDGSAVIKARLSADDGTGSATGVSGEGNFIKQADISTITRLIKNVTAGTDDGGASLTVSSTIVDTPVTSSAKWKTDATGYNFIDIIPATKFATGGSVYQVEYKITLTGGLVLWLKLVGEADACYTS